MFHITSIVELDLPDQSELFGFRLYLLNFSGSGLSGTDSAHVKPTSRSAGLDIDLTEPDGARNAFYGQSLLSSVLGHDGPWSAMLHLVRENLDVGKDLFSRHPAPEEA